MSDLQTNPEIEDVLSSIRRLVSEGGRHGSAPAPAPAQDEPDSKLVLTDALRVAGNEPESLPDDGKAADTAADTDAGPVSQAAVDDPQSYTGRQSLEATIAELEVAVARIGDDFEPDGGEVAMPDEARDRDETIEDGSGADEADEPAATVGEAEQVTTEASDDAGADAPEEESVRRSDASLDRYDDEPWAVRTGDADTLPDAPASGPEWPDRDDATEARDLDDEADVTTGTGATRRLHLGAADAVSGFEPAEPRSGDEPAASPEPESAYRSDGDQEDAEIEALRALVSELIRQELQGALGERVTRNMRMLIRREIQRALDCRETD